MNRIRRETHTFRVDRLIMSGGSRISRQGTEKMLSRFSLALSSCEAQSAAYGSCITKLGANVEFGACAKELVALQACFMSAMTKQRPSSSK